MAEILRYFPEDLVGGPPNSSQRLAIPAVEQAFKEKDVVILEAPVGSGKSAVALTLARIYGTCHILTPRKSLQDQYYEDFKKISVLMKGRGAYPCTIYRSDREYKEVIKEIEQGMVMMKNSHRTCAEGPCRNSLSIYDKCTQGGEKPCPYRVAITVACKNPIVIHNVHSFIYQSTYGKHFEPKELLVVDEAHMLEKILRDFATITFTLPRFVQEKDFPDFDTLEQWGNWFLSSEFLPREEEERAEYIEKVTNLKVLDRDIQDFIIEKTSNQVHRVSKIQFIPKKLFGLAQNFIFNYGKKILLMSGTIYDHKYFCNVLGIDSSKTTFIRLSSSFPVENRPIYCKDWHMIDTSFKSWEDNLFGIRDILRKILATFNDCKGLIHTPSYAISKQLVDLMEDPRLITHTSDTFQEQLEGFFNKEGNEVFVSPTCQEGVDFKGDRARFQIIIRVPYQNTSDAFTSHLVRENFPAYNYNALLTFGQMLGRINRSPSDEGSTILLDKRFIHFIRKNAEKLPKWLRESIQYR